MSAPPSDTAWEAAWDEDSSKFYDDDTGWSERGYAQGFAAGATWGAEWYAGHMAVCEFLSDLAAQVNACPDCYDGLAGVPWDRLSYMACDTSGSGGSRGVGRTGSGSGRFSAQNSTRLGLSLRVRATA